MNKPKASVFVSIYAYGGNGGIASVSPGLMMWWAKTYYEIKNDPLIDFKGAKVYSDTPITMVRNRAVEDAKLLKADMILMLDSDNIPDGYLGQYSAVKPFWSTAFNFAYERLVKGIPTVIAAPYCGPPPPPVDEPGVDNMGEVPYLFEWADKESDNPQGVKRLSLLTRNEASRLAGIYPVAALPTGVCLFTLSAFEGLKQPYFRYEMDAAGAHKKSTEDVVATRDISLFWKITKGYDVLFATCDSWAFHAKTKLVGRPQHVPIDSISEDFADAIRRNWAAADEVRQVDFTENLGIAKNAEFAYDSAEAFGGVSAETGPKPPAIDLPRTELFASGLKPDFEVTENDLRETKMENDLAVAKPPKTNGKPLTSRIIGKHKVKVVGKKLPDEVVEGIQDLARYVSEKNGGPIKAAVIHPKSGEGTAAILSVLPDDSRVHAYSWGNPEGNHSDYFKEAFKKDMEMGVVKADLDGKQAPDVAEQWSDMAFFEVKPDEQQLERWFANVSPRGLLCGVGYDSPEVRAVVNKFKDDYALPLQENKGVWAIPVGDIAHA